MVFTYLLLVVHIVHFAVVAKLRKDVIQASGHDFVRKPRRQISIPYLPLSFLLIYLLAFFSLQEFVRPRLFSRASGFRLRPGNLITYLLRNPSFLPLSRTGLKTTNYLGLTFFLFICVQYSCHLEDRQDGSGI